LRSNIIGENLSDVSATLAELGMTVNAIPGDVVPAGDSRARTVYAVSPTGNIAVGSTIDVTYYVENVEDVPVEIPEPEVTDPASDSATVSDPATGDTSTEVGTQG
jgi:serine/threonine-protein kinase